MPSAAHCPECGKMTHAGKPIHTETAVRRRRICMECRHRYTTYERIGPDVPEDTQQPAASRKPANGTAKAPVATSGFGPLGTAQPAAPRWTAAVQKQVQEYMDAMLLEWTAGRLHTEGGTLLNPPPPDIEDMSLEDQYDAFVAARDA